jgi:hypothetical protein
VATGHLDRLVVFGSYVSDVAEPNDVDVVLVMRDDFATKRCPSDSLVLFDHRRADDELGASVFRVRHDRMPERSDAMQSTREQMHAVRNGESVRLIEGGTQVVVLRADVFEKMRNLAYDDDPWTDEEMDRLAAEDADALGWDGMDAYQDVDR